MSIEANGSSVIDNRDIHASRALSDTFPALKPLIDNELLSNAFDRHNAAAIRWKLIYVQLGSIGLLCVLLAMVIFDYQVTLQPLYGSVAFLSGLSATLVGAGLASQLFLIFSNAKEKWITQRFVAERLRCLKFQAFALLAVCADVDTLKSTVASWTSAAIAALDQEIMGGRAAVLDFSPSEISLHSPTTMNSNNRAFLADAYKVYDSLRLAVQAQHFSEQYRLSESEARWPALLSEFCFGAGVVLAFIQISFTSWTQLAHGAMRGLNGWSGWLAFVTLLFFIVSAIVAVYQRGSGHEPDAERYLAYVREVRRIRLVGAGADSDAFFQSIREMEEIALRELHDFCRDSKHSNYMF
jgi:hypothetical protein